MAVDRKISRRTLLVGGGAGAGLALAWALWPRSYRPNLRTAPGETLFNAFLKIGSDGRVIVAVPQVEIGQGVYTSLPQILADELGADWRTVSVEPAPLSPLYANELLAGPDRAFGAAVRLSRHRPLGRSRICHSERAGADRRLHVDQVVRAAHAGGGSGGARTAHEGGRGALGCRLGST
jgi:hypothetical protein